MSRTQAWIKLEKHRAAHTDLTLRELLGEDQRFQKYSIEHDGILLDYSKNLLTSTTKALLFDLVRESGFNEARKALVSGEKINTTEERAVLHTALRDRSGNAVRVDGVDVMGEIRHELEKMRGLVESLTHGEFLGCTGEPIRQVVSIGIGGCDLGAVMATTALEPYRTNRLGLHFVSNVDGVQLSDTLDVLRPEETLFIVCSKSFTTPETLSLAHLAKDWLFAHTRNASMASHFVGVSANDEAMGDFGIGPENRFKIWDWVGGRYSLWSAMGLPTAIAVGMDHFEQLLAGAHAMDEHLRTAPVESNMPVILALVGIWNRNFCNCASHAVLPYDQRLNRLPAYLQQLEMESNGKRVSRDGQTLEYDTAPIVWGEPGSNAQHSFFQLLHQGTSRVSVDFVAPVNGSGAFARQHALGLANCLAQGRALADGWPADSVRQAMVDAGDSEQAMENLAPHKIHLGNRPSNLILFPRLDPLTLGKLIALYEHKVFVQGLVWGINSFDQWGVELGKKLATSYLEIVRNPGNSADLDPYTQEIVRYLDLWRD